MATSGRHKWRPDVAIYALSLYTDYPHIASNTRVRPRQDPKPTVANLEWRAFEDEDDIPFDENSTADSAPTYKRPQSEVIFPKRR